MAEKKTMALVKDILPDVLNSISRRDIQDQISLEKLWQDTLGGDVDRAIIVGFRDGCIFASVNNPAMLFKMRLRRQEILKKMKAKRKDVENISFKIGRMA